MRIAETIGEYIVQNTNFVGGDNLFLNYLPETIKDGVVVRMISTEVTGVGQLREAYMVVYYITTNPAEADSQIDSLRNLLIRHRGLGDDGWSVMGWVEVETESMNNSYHNVVSLRFKVAYRED